MNAQEVIDSVLDAGSWGSWDAPIPPRDVNDDYARDLARAASSSGRDEAVITGSGTLSGRRVAVLVSEFSFLAGSIGVSTADRLIAAIERATDERLPLLASPVSGGTRMQEGTSAFVRIAGITAAINRHKAAGLAYLVYLRGPTFGGVLASWGSLGHVTIAEPGAAVGFLGPRVYQALYQDSFPTGVQVAENLAVKGVIDAVVPHHQLASVANRALNVLAAAAPEPRKPVTDARSEDHEPPTADRSAWEVVIASRRPSRPGIRKLLRTAATDVLPLNGTGAGEAAPGLLLALGAFGGVPCIVLGHDRRDKHPSEPLGPAALREARRGMRLASELRLPLLTVIDTAGATLSQEAEEGGVAGEIARCLQDLLSIDTPTLSVLLGQGTGGAALALLPADRVLAAANSWLGPLPPEGASAITYHDTAHAPEMAGLQGITAIDLWNEGTVDRVIAEKPDAADEPAAFCHRLGRIVATELRTLIDSDCEVRLNSRRLRYSHPHRRMDG